MKITAIFIDGFSKDFEVEEVVGSSFLHDGLRPVRFIHEKGMSDEEVWYLQRYLMSESLRIKIEKES